MAIESSDYRPNLNIDFDRDDRSDLINKYGAATADVGSIIEGLKDKEAAARMRTELQGRVQKLSPKKQAQRQELLDRIGKLGEIADFEGTDGEFEALRMNLSAEAKCDLIMGRTLLMETRLKSGFHPTRRFGGVKRVHRRRDQAVATRAHATEANELSDKFRSTAQGNNPKYKKLNFTDYKKFNFKNKTVKKWEEQLNKLEAELKTLTGHEDLADVDPDLAKSIGTARTYLNALKLARTVRNNYSGINKADKAFLKKMAAFRKKGGDAGSLQKYNTACKMYHEISPKYEKAVRAHEEAKRADTRGKFKRVFTSKPKDVKETKAQVESLRSEFKGAEKAYNGAKARVEKALVDPEKKASVVGDKLFPITRDLDQLSRELESTDESLPKGLKDYQKHAAGVMEGVLLLDVMRPTHLHSDSNEDAKDTLKHARPGSYYVYVPAGEQGTTFTLNFKNSVGEIESRSGRIENGLLLIHNDKGKEMRASSIAGYLEARGVMQPVAVEPGEVPQYNPVAELLSSARTFKLDVVEKEDKMEHPESRAEKLLEGKPPGTYLSYIDVEHGNKLRMAYVPARGGEIKHRTVEVDKLHELVGVRSEDGNDLEIVGNLQVFMAKVFKNTNVMPKQFTTRDAMLESIKKSPKYHESEKEAKLAVRVRGDWSLTPVKNQPGHFRVHGKTRYNNTGSFQVSISNGYVEVVKPYKTKTVKRKQKAQLAFPEKDFKSAIGTALIEQFHLANIGGRLG